MLAKRIVPCLDIKDGQTVKGTNFVNLRQAGDPVELGRAYSEQGADELVFLDITASHEGRKTFTELVKRIAANINIPFTVGGGINELSDVDRLLNAGADKISINSSAIRNPQLIDEIAKNFGSQVCVLAVDAKQTEKGWKCYLNGGRIETDKDLFDWTKEAQERGAGEILFTSMNHDGVKTGYANEALAALAGQLSVPVIASGGAGCKEHFRDVFLQGKADAALAASVFHFGEIKIPENEPGSSIMPGKVNPVIPEVVSQVAFHVIGNDTAITMAAEAGQMELNAFEPVVFYSLFDSIDTLKEAVETLTKNCIHGITANEAHCRSLVDKSVGISTALCPYLGYKESADIAKTALRENKSVREIVLERKLMSEADLEHVLNPEMMTEVHFEQRKAM